MASGSKIHEFDPVIYPRKLWVVKGSSQRFIQDNFTERLGEEVVFENDEGNESVCTVLSNVRLKETGKYGYLVYIRGNLSVGDIAHEATHVAARLFQEIGSYLDPENQEPFSYLVGWVTDCINQVKTGKSK